MFSAFGISDYFAYLLGTVAIILLPGPNSMYCMYVASAQGIKKGYQTALAIFLGDTVLMLGAVLGAGALLKTSATMFVIFKILGGLYLAYIGINLLIASYKGWKDPTHHLEDDHLNPIDDARQQTKLSESLADSLSKPKKSENVFLKALTLSLSNPKAILFFLSFFIQFVDPNYTQPMVSFAILGVTLQVISMLYLSTLIFAGSGLARFFRKRYRLASFGNGLVGLLFMSFAVTLWRAEA